MATAHWLVALTVLCALLATAAGPAGSFVGAAPTDPDVSCGRDSAGGKRCGAPDDNTPDPHVRRIIHATSLLAALADGALAQVPGVGSMTVVPTIQAAMVGIIGRHYGCQLDSSNALAVVTWLVSGHAKKAMFKEIIGYIPLAGNVVKAGITGFMTEGIGKLAEGMLRCPKTTQDLLKNAQVGSESVQKAKDTTRHLYHAVSDYLGRVDMASLSSLSAEEAWQRAQLLFSSKSQAQLLLEVEEASDAASLANIVKKHAWNLEVLAAALSALTRRFSEERGSCMVVDFVGERLWAPARADAEARATTAPYLLTCLAHATPETRRALAVASARLVIDTHGGSRGGLTPIVVQQALELVTVTAEEPMAAAASDLDQDATLVNDSLQDDDSLASDRLAVAEPALSISEITATFSAAMLALQAGQGAACGALRALLRAEAGASSAGSGSVLASVRQLELLLRTEVPAGAELCLPSLRADLTALLSLAAAPANAERPGGTVLGEAGSTAGTRGRGGQLEGILSAVVGQRCALDRLAKHARLKLRGLWAEKPMVLLLPGPSGTGKTMTARLLAEVLLGRPIADLEATGRFRTFHMNVFSMIEDQKSFFGPPKGIVGVGDLPELLKMWPDAVILLDECEKAHPSFARALLKVFGEHGAVYDPRTGKDVSSVNATFILTSNLAKDLISEHATATMKLTDSDCTSYGALQEDVLDALQAPFIRGRENFFRESEVRGRLTDVLPFLPFGRVEVESAVRRFLAAESEVFQRSPEFSHASLAWEPEVVAFLASEHARRPEEGLRGVHTKLQAKVREVFEHAIEAGLLQRSGEVVLRVRPGTPSSLDLRVVPPLRTARPSPVLPWRGVPQDAPSSNDGSGGLGWWPLDMGVSSWQLPNISGESTVGVEWERQWEKLRDWDWEILWQQLREILWDYWPLLAVAGVALFAVAATPLAVGTSVPLAAPAFTAAAPAAASAAASAPTAVAAAAAGAGAAAGAPWVSGILAGLQLVVPVGTTAVTAYGATYVWQNRRLIVAIATGVGLATLLLPPLLQILWRRLRRRCARLGDESPVRRTRSRKPDDASRRRRVRPKTARSNEEPVTQMASGVIGNTSSEIDGSFFSPAPDRAERDVQLQHRQCRQDSDGSKEVVPLLPQASDDLVPLAREDIPSQDDLDSDASRFAAPSLGAGLGQSKDSRVEDAPKDCPKENQDRNRNANAAAGKGQSEDCFMGDTGPHKRMSRRSI